MRFRFDHEASSKDGSLVNVIERVVHSCLGHADDEVIK
jgi:hypothetical protein